jgi:hypothetical protein
VTSSWDQFRDFLAESSVVCTVLEPRALHLENHKIDELEIFRKPWSFLTIELSILTVDLRRNVERIRKATSLAAPEHPQMISHDQSGGKGLD